MTADLEALNAPIVAALPDLVERLRAAGLDAVTEGDSVRVPMPQGFYVEVVADLGGWYAGAWTDAGLPATLDHDDNYVYASPVDDDGFTAGADTGDLVDALAAFRSGFVD